MSAKEMFEEYPSDPQAWRNESMISKTPPMILLAEEFSEAGREALQKKERVLDNKDLTALSFSRLTQDEQAAIFMGHLIVGLNELVKEGSFDLELLVERFNFDISGTLAVPLYLSDEYRKVIELDSYEHNKIKQVYSEDKTFSSFLEEEEHLPGELYDFITKEFPPFYSKSFHEILEIWKERAGLLIGQQEIIENDVLSITFTDEEAEKLYELRDRYESGDNVF